MRKRMKIKIEKRFIVFPVNLLASKKRVTFLDGGEPVYSLMIALDNISPDFSAYIDLSRFMGKELELSVAPLMDFTFKTADEMTLDDLYSELLRPRVHFTAKNGWLNDPNGLLFLDGVYHMFYQHNPCAPEWANIHWGHATSRDLVHWVEEPIALFPDSTGMKYSGSGILDARNVTGLGSPETPPALLFYTATSPFSQHLAYSTDGFKTVKKYDKNPVVPHVVKSNRDPKVVWCDEWNAYLMALYFEKDVYAFFRSSNLLSWQPVQKIELTGDNECPDIFQIKASDGNKKWVFMGAHNRYVVGTMGKNGFNPEQDTRSLHYGTAAYAGQTFSGLPGGRVVRIDWDRWNTKVDRFRSQMSVPLELTLEKVDGIYYLCAGPVKEFGLLYNEVRRFTNITVGNGHPVSHRLERSAYFVKLKINDFSNASQFMLRIFGRDLTVKPSENELVFAKEVIPLSVSQSCIDLSIVVDCCSFEIFLDNGKIYASYLNNASVSDYNLPYVELHSENPLTVDSFELISLKTIWDDR